MAERIVLTFTTTIERPPEVVFDYIADVSKHAEWSPKPYRVEGSTRRVNVGDTFTSVGTIPGDKNHRNEVMVAECSSPRRLVLDSLEKSKIYEAGGSTRYDEWYARFFLPAALFGLLGLALRSSRLSGAP